MSVPDLDKAIKWYQEVFGFTVVNGPVEFEADDSSLGIAAKDIHGPNFKKMRMVWLSSGNQVGFEIFEYIDPKAERRTNNFEYWKSGQPSNAANMSSLEMANPTRIYPIIV